MRKVFAYGGFKSSELIYGVPKLGELFFYIVAVAGLFQGFLWYIAVNGHGVSLAVTERKLRLRTFLKLYGEKGFCALFTSAVKLMKLGKNFGGGGNVLFLPCAEHFSAKLAVVVAVCKAPTGKDRFKGF